MLLKLKAKVTNSSTAPLIDSIFCIYVETRLYPALKKIVKRKQTLQKITSLAIYTAKSTQNDLWTSVGLNLWKQFHFNSKNINSKAKIKSFTTHTQYAVKNLAIICQGSYNKPGNPIRTSILPHQKRYDHFRWQWCQTLWFPPKESEKKGEVKSSLNTI